MSEEQTQEIIIVRRRVESEDGHHGGAWKIAYADFVTAMMAFFLVLWILNSTNKDSQTIIARYFNPVKMEDFAKSPKGIREQHQHGGRAAASEGEPDKSPPSGPLSGQDELKGREAAETHARAPMSDESLFRNPYVALEQIAGKAPEPRKDAPRGSAGQRGALDAFHDPFRSPDGDIESEERVDPAPTEPLPAEEVKDPKPPATGAPAAEARTEPPPTAQAPATASANAMAAEARAAALQKEIAHAVKSEAGENAPHIEVTLSEEGVLISLTDRESFGMFEIGSSTPNPKLVRLMETIAKSLKDQPGAVVLRGFTDARRYRNGASDNWRLSASRAQMALYMLARGGLSETRIERVEGYADRRLRNPEKPEAAENRRIEILLRKAAP